MSDVLEDEVNSAVRDADHFSLMFDETTDCAIIEQLVIHVRYIDSAGKLQVKFLKICDVMKPINAESETQTDTSGIHDDNPKQIDVSLNASTISSPVLELIKANNINISKLNGIGLDGAAVMTGSKNGTVRKIKDAQKYAQSDKETVCEAIGMHCAAHKLNLAAGQAGNFVKYIKKCKDILQKVYDFYDNSSVRSVGLEAVQRLFKQPILKIIQPSSSGWLSVGNSILRLKKVLPCVIISLDRETEERKDIIAAGLHHFLNDVTFVETMLLLCDILPTVNRLSKTFQFENIDYSVVNKVTRHWSYDPLVLRPIGPTAHWSYDPLVLRPFS